MFIAWKWQFFKEETEDTVAFIVWTPTHRQFLFSPIRARVAFGRFQESSSISLGCLVHELMATVVRGKSCIQEICWFYCGAFCWLLNLLVAKQWCNLPQAACSTQHRMPLVGDHKLLWHSTRCLPAKAEQWRRSKSKKIKAGKLKGQTPRKNKNERPQNEQVICPKCRQCLDQ